MIKYAKFLLILLFVFLVFAAGCRVQRSSAPARRYFMLEADRTGQRRSSGYEAVLEVEGFETSPTFQGSELIYRTGSVAYESDYYRAFLTDVSSQISYETRVWLAESGLFKSVINTSGVVKATHMLEGNVISLYGDFRDEAAPAAVMELQFFFLDVSGKDVEIELDRVYRDRVLLDENTPRGLIMGYNKALERILGKLESDLAKLSSE